MGTLFLSAWAFLLVDLVSSWLSSLCTDCNENAEELLDPIFIDVLEFDAESLSEDVSASIVKETFKNEINVEVS